VKPFPSLRLSLVAQVGAAAVIAFAAGLHLGARPVSEVPETPITRVLEDQVAAWNRGDIDGFMAGYEVSDTLRFASGGDVTRGWKSTLDRYRNRYPDKAAMGTLAFSNLEVTPLGSDAAVVFGQWRLTRGNDSPQGLFTLTLKKNAGRWRILQDHTSSAAP
jgi:ketosteroid isomerase-like protein